MEQDGITPQDENRPRKKLLPRSTRKKYGKYRNKLLLLFAALVMISTSIILSVFYFQAREFIFEEFQSKLRSIAATAAQFIDGDLHKGLKSQEDADTEQYRTIENLLRKVRNANRRDDLFVNYVYTMMYSPQSRDTYLFGVDAEENFEDKSQVGDVYKGEWEGDFILEEISVDESPVYDQWGVWISAFAPFYDKKGDFVATVGLDVSYENVLNKYKRLRLIGLTGLGASLVFALLFSLFMARRVTTPLRAIKKQIEEIGDGNLDFEFTVKTNDEFEEMSEAINVMAHKIKEGLAVRSRFSRYVSRQVVDKILQDDLAVKGERRKVTVLFSDIRGFTTLTEKMNPAIVVEMLNDYFEKMIDVVFNYKGTLDKFIGDGMMVIFGAPDEDMDQEEHAVRVAVEMQKEIRKLNREWQTKYNLPPIRIGIGINSGIAIVGNIGSQRRMEYTAIGDTVNLASRLEAATSDLGCGILISEYTYIGIRHLFDMRQVDTIHVKGRVDPVVGYEVLGVKET